MSDAADLNRKIASLTEVVNTLERRIASFSHQNACNGYKDNNGLDLEEKVLALEDAVNVLEQNMKQVIPTVNLCVFNSIYSISSSFAGVPPRSCKRDASLRHGSSVSDSWDSRGVGSWHLLYATIREPHA